MLHAGEIHERQGCPLVSPGPDSATGSPRGQHVSLLPDALEIHPIDREFTADGASGFTAGSLGDAVTSMPCTLQHEMRPPSAYLRATWGSMVIPGQAGGESHTR